MILLANDRQPIPIRLDHVYFAFPSGRLGYDCVSCGAKCCRAHGYEVLVGRELQQQLATRQTVRFFLDPCEAGDDNHLHARTFNPGCFFLDRQNRCSVHVDHGFAAKPETCRLFPFNDLHRVGEFLIVAPHPRLCPLTVLPSGEASEASNHDDLLAMMSASGIGTHVGETAAGGGDVAAVIAFERRICELTEGQLHARRYAGLAAAQLEASGRAVDDVEPFLEMLDHVLGERRPEGDDRDATLVRTMVGMTSAIRARILFGYGELPDPVEIARIPYLLLALHTFAALAGEAGMAEVTFQTVMGLFDTFRPLLLLLANVDRVMVWTASAKLDFAVSGSREWQERYRAVATALLPDVQHTAQAPLGRILCEHADANGLDRVVFLKRVARQLNGRIEPMA